MAEASPLPLLLSALLVLPFLLYQAFKFLHPLHNLADMTISDIYIYPVKSLRGIRLSDAVATKHGFKHDRSFMLLRLTSHGYQNMAVSRYPEMTQFLTDIQVDSEGNRCIAITYTAFSKAGEVRSIKIPLEPDVQNLESFRVTLHGSSTESFKMPNVYSQWFSECLEYDVLFVYLGNNKRDVLFTELAPDAPSPLTSFVHASIPCLAQYLPGPLSARPHITFADCAPYLVVSNTSLIDVSSRLPQGEDMDVTKFRPNIVLDGAREAWQEDYWAKIRVNNSAELSMRHNCVRCKSINVDYVTGKPGTGASGDVLRKLQKDRRVDAGSRWSPVFGRYTFWDKNLPSQSFKVGDLVQVIKTNPGYTVWSWPGLA